MILWTLMMQHVQMAEEIKKFIYVWYDEETDTEYETPVLKDIDFS